MEQFLSKLAFRCHSFTPIKLHFSSAWWAHSLLPSRNSCHSSFLARCGPPSGREYDLLCTREVLYFFVLTPSSTLALFHHMLCYEHITVFFCIVFNISNIQASNCPCSVEFLSMISPSHTLIVQPSFSRISHSILSCSSRNSR